MESASSLGSSAGSGPGKAQKEGDKQFNLAGRSGLGKNTTEGRRVRFLLGSPPLVCIFIKTLKDLVSTTAVGALAIPWSVKKALM